MKSQTRTAIGALVWGLVLLVATVLMILRVTNDMRWVLVLGSAGLLAGAAWVGSRRGGVIPLALLCLPLILFFWRLAVPQLPGLWPHMVLWLALALVGWLGLRSGRARSVATLGALALVTGVGAWYAFDYVPGEISRTLNRQLDDPAPEYSFVSLAGDPFPMESLEGKVVVLDFFATWCAPCIAELPEIDSIHRQYAAAPDVEVFVVANDSGKDTPESIQAFVEARGFAVPFVYDHDGTSHKAFGFLGLPGLIVIDRGNQVRFMREGYNAAETDFRENLVGLIESLRSGSDA